VTRSSEKRSLRDGRRVNPVEAAAAFGSQAFAHARDAALASLS
jgi:hypothetical protein